MAIRLFLQHESKDDFLDFLNLAKEWKVGLEFTGFEYPSSFHDKWKEDLEWYVKQLKGFKGPISMHGVYEDLYPASRDPKIVEVTEKRFKGSLDIAKKVGAEAVIFHPNYNPLVRTAAYRKEWIQHSIKFWKGFLKNLKGNMTILLENLWEDEPSILKEVIDGVSSKKLKLCLDTGHVNTSSKVPMVKWLELLGKRIGYVHLSDNNGWEDQHLPLGEGNIKWEEFFEIMKNMGLKPDMCIEADTRIEASVKSRDVLENYGVL